MVLIYESDPLDNDDARGRFYHVCRGRSDRTEIELPAGEKIDIDADVRILGKLGAQTVGEGERLVLRHGARHDVAPAPKRRDRRRTWRSAA